MRFSGSLMPKWLNFDKRAEIFLSFVDFVLTIKKDLYCVSVIGWYLSWRQSYTESLHKYI